MLLKDRKQKALSFQPEFTAVISVLLKAARCLQKKAVVLGIEKRATEIGFNECLGRNGKSAADIMLLLTMFKYRVTLTTPRKTIIPEPLFPTVSGYDLPGYRYLARYT